jgi:hypothetical protein
MTCIHFLALIDTRGLTRLPADQYETAMHHADNCAACRAALALADALDAELNCLLEPMPPSGLATSVAARIARVDEGLTPRFGPELRAVTQTAKHDWLAWSGALAGFVVGLAAEVYILLTGELPLDLTSSRIGGWNSLIQMPDAGVTVFFLTVGLSLYFAGIHALCCTRSSQPES